jgi:hypothetical protein
VTVSGSGEYAGSDLATQQTEVEVSGSGNAKVNVTDSLTATVTGSGNVTYTGNPAQVQQDSSGSGDIVPG